jgi:hypothetical protein
MNLVAKEPVPLFSIIRFASSDLVATRRSLAAVQAQSCGDFEFIVVCDDANAPCIQFLRTAAQADTRLKVFHPGPVDAGEALLLALRQCHGEYIAFCPSDGILLPDALQVALGRLRLNSEVGGLCCGGFLIDSRGRSLADANIVTLLLSDARPYLPAGFLRRAALLDCGLNENDWSTTSIELEIWCRIATRFGLLSVDDRVVDVRAPQNEVYSAPVDLELAIEQRLKVVSSFFSADGFFEGTNPALTFESQINQLSLLRGQLEAFGLGREKERIDRHLRHVVDGLRQYLMVDHRVLRTLHRLTFNRAHVLGWLGAPLQGFLALLDRMTGRPPIHAGYSLWNFPWIGPWLTHTMFVKGSPASDARVEQARPQMFADLYTMAAALYDSRGQIEQALTMWTLARRPENVAITSLACQALLKLPGLTAASLAENQREWIAPHVQGCIPTSPGKVSIGGKKIRVGYHCSFMNSNTIRAQMGNVIAARDRDRFEVFGYSPQRYIEGVTPSFDVFRHTPSLDDSIGDPPTIGKRVSDADFVDIVRKDNLDIFVELTGFTPGHRFVAMARRVAPVQVSYLNHLGTSQVPNVDYLLGDEIGTPSNANDDRHFSERIYRLPGCFFCFDYTCSDEPPVGEPPSTRNSFVTFGYFGSGSKLNLQVIETWAKLLRRVPTSKLHIQNGQLSTASNRKFLIDRFGSFGIPANRLIVAGGVDRRTLMGLYAGIDVSLDTWPYCGGNTIAESLWQGVPVVTLRGDRFVSAYGASLVAAAGCADLAANSLEEYLEIAVRLANDPARLLRLRQSLRRMSIEYGLADSADFSRRLEAAYTDMLHRLTWPREQSAASQNTDRVAAATS